MQAGLGQMILTALGPSTSVSWVYGEISFDSLPNDFVSLSILSGPLPARNRFPSGSPCVFPPSIIDFSIDAVSIGSLDRITINEVDYSHDVGALDTVTIIRDAILALMVADAEYVSWTAVALGADAIRVTSPVTGIFQAGYLGDISHVATYHATSVQIRESSKTFNIQIQAFSKSREPYNGAWSMISQIQDAIMTQSVIDSLYDDYGIVLHDPVSNDPQNLSALAGPNWETRANLDLKVNLASTISVAVDYFDAVEMTISPSGFPEESFIVAA